VVLKKIAKDFLFPTNENPWWPSFYILRVMVMVFNTTFNNISVISSLSVLLVEETGVPGENHRSAVSHRLHFDLTNQLAKYCGAVMVVIVW
jgi:hypothetical protein